MINDLSQMSYWESSVRRLRVRIRMIDHVLLYCQSVLMISFETWRHDDDVTCKLVRFIFLPLRSIRRYVQIDQGEIVLHTLRHLRDRLVAFPVWHMSFDKVIVNESRRSSFLDNWIVHIAKSDLDTRRLLIIMSSILIKVLIRTTWNITLPDRSCQWYSSVDVIFSVLLVSLSTMIRKLFVRVSCRIITLHLSVRKKTGRERYLLR